jgi:DNA topoisomerase-1
MGQAKLHKTLTKIQRDPLLTAKAAGLTYVSDTGSGWFRRRRGTQFYYVDADGKKCTDPDVLERIRRLVLPPAWENVWICTDANGHLQATGVDGKGRKQYRYHPSWSDLRSQTKYFRLPQFAEALPMIRTRLEADLKQSGIPYEKVLALAVSLIEQTNIRVGNEAYTKLYGSFGLTTLQDKHVKIDGAAIRFQFKGKKGIYHTIDLRSRRLARLIQQCKDITGKELFQYIDPSGVRHSIGSGDVNSYLKNITGLDYTAKDFRTWAGTVAAFRALRAVGPAETATERKQNIVAAIDQVAGELGNTRTVCRKYYIHPAILIAYENGELAQWTAPEPQNEAEKQLTADELTVKAMLAEYVFDAVT